MTGRRRHTYLRRVPVALTATALATLGWLGTVAAPAPAGFASTPPADVELLEPGTHEWTVPTGVVCATFDVYGANGGEGGAYDYSLTYFGGSGGKGGRTTASLEVTPGEVITLTVGGYGESGLSYDSGPGVAGFNGGGTGGTSFYTGGAGGGGASDVRRGGTDLAHRVIVAGGGGGGGGAADPFDGGDGGAGGLPAVAGAAGEEVQGGGVAGQPVSYLGLGGGAGTLTAGGEAGTQSPAPYEFVTPATAGALGQGGDGGASPEGGGAGGGGAGGGWYGGGGGGGGYGKSGGGGGGGSSYGPANAVFETGVGATNDDNGKILVRWTPGDTSCQAVAPAAVVTDPAFTG